MDAERQQMNTKLLLALTICAAGLGYALGTRSLVSPVPVTLAATEPADNARPGATPLADARISEGAARALAALSAPKQLSDFADIHSLLAGLQPGDFPRIMDIMQRLPAEVQNQSMVLVFRAWIACDLESARAWGLGITEKQALSGFSISGGAARAIAETWATQFRDDALAFARRHWPKEGAKHVLHQFLWSCPKDQFPQCLALLQTMPADPKRKASISSFFQNWVQSDAQRAMEAATAMPPGIERTSAIAQVIGWSAQSKPQKAFEQALEAGITDARFLSALGTEAGWSKGAETAKWFAESAPDLISIAGPALVSAWARQDANAALLWALANGISLTKRELGQTTDPENSLSWTTPLRGSSQSPLMDAMREKPAETVAWLTNLPAGTERDEWLQYALETWNSGSEALKIFAALPPHRQPSAAASVVSRAFKNQTGKAREWAATLPVGPIQDAAWNGIGRTDGVPSDYPAGRARDLMLEGRATIYTPEPLQVLTEVSRISDPVIRRRAFENVMWGALHENGDAVSKKAREALEATDFPAEWKMPLRDSLKL